MSVRSSLYLGSNVSASPPPFPCTLCTLHTTLSRGFALLRSPYAAYSLNQGFSAKRTFSAASCLVHRWGPSATLVQMTTPAIRKPLTPQTKDLS